MRLSALHAGCLLCPYTARSCAKSTPLEEGFGLMRHDSQLVLADNGVFQTRVVVRALINRLKSVHSRKPCNRKRPSYPSFVKDCKRECGHRSGHLERNGYTCKLRAWSLH